MDQRERADAYEESLLALVDGRQAQIWTCLPGIIESYDPASQTAVVQPAIMGLQRAKDGSTQLVKMPLLADCPVEFPSGGGCTLTFPIAAGDECTVHFSSRCIDAWWQSGGVQPQAEVRMHDLSDGFVVVGPRSKPRALTGVSTTAVELRSDDDATKVSLNPSAQTVAITAPGGVNINGVTIDSIGNLTSPKTINGQTDVVGGAPSISLKGHKHTGVTTGAGTSGGPTN